MNPDVLNTILGVSLLVFIVTSMLAMGLSLTVGQIVAALKNSRLVVLALLANVTIGPWGLAEALSLDEERAIGLSLMRTAAGASFLPKLGEFAKRAVGWSVL